MRKLWQTDQLLWNALELIDYAHPYSTSPSFHFAFIDDIITRSSSKDRGRIDNLLYMHLSDMAAMNEAISSIKYHRSHETTTIIEHEARYALENWEKDRAGMRVRDLTWSEDGNPRLWAKLADFLAMPMPSKEVTAESISRIKALHGALDAYCHEVWEVKGYHLIAADVPKDEVIAYVLSFRALLPSGEHLASAKFITP